MELTNIGAIGEQVAVEYLMESDYRLLERNWQSGHHEIDIVAEHFGLVIFIEVKASAGSKYGVPESRVDAEKERFLVAAARAYINTHRLTGPFRFDIIAVEGSSPPYHLRHIRNAFEPPVAFPSLPPREWNADGEALNTP